VAPEDLSTPWRSYLPELAARTLLDHDGHTQLAGAKSFDAVVLFADIVGFTPMSEAFGRTGDQGAEELTRILNGWFDRMAHEVSRYGGVIADFAGDALVAVFRYDGHTRRATLRRAVQCALDMQAAMADFRAIRTPYGSFSVTMKVGLGDGPMLVAVMGIPDVRLVCVLAGPAHDRAIEAERHAGSGEVLLPEELLRARAGIEVSQRRGRWGLVARLRRPPEPVRPRRHDELEEIPGDRLVPFLHPAIAERLRLGRRDLVNEHRKVTVAFVGLADLEATVASSVDALQRTLVAALQVVADYDGYLHQVATGDKGTLLIVYFGAPVSHEDDEERAVRCCLDLLRLPNGPVRASVTTGFVYCGEAGSDSRRVYTVMGDSVNLAARLMEAAQPRQLLVDQSTHHRIRDTALGTPLEPLTVKGKTGTLAVWSVAAVREAAGLPSSAVPAEPVVGRKVELTRLRSLVRRAHSGAGQVAGITGEAGIGKSRLAAEVARMARAQGFTVYGGACRSHGTSTSYLVWRSIWRDLLELDTAAPLPVQQAHVTTQVARHTPGGAAQAPLLAPILNLPMPDSELTASLDPHERDELLRVLLRDFLQERVRRGPVLLLLEDCHWIDRASRGLLGFVARTMADQAVLIVATARMDSASPFSELASLEWFTEIRLPELPASAAEALVAQRLRRRYGEERGLAADVVRRLADRGEGNPFFLEELVAFLHGRDVDPGDSRALAGLELPPSLQRLMMARIDQLTEGEKATIKVASVIGRRFRAGWISGAYPAAGSPEEVARHLEHLAELDLTPLRTPDRDPEYGFRHAITQEAAYHSLTLDLRQTLHERVGELVEASYADRLAQYVDVLAYHYGRSRRVDKQRVWYRAAGDSAKTAFANDAAVDYYERLLPLLDETETGPVLAEMGAVWQLTGMWERAEAAYRRAMEIAPKAGNRRLLAASLRDLGSLLMHSRSDAEAVALLTQAIQEFERLGDRPGLCSALEHLTFAFWRQSAYSEALATAERHLALATEEEDLAGMSMALNHMGLVRSSTGDAATALELLERALDIARRADNQRSVIHAANNLAVVHFWHGDQQRAAGYWQEVLTAGQRIGYRQSVAAAIGNLGEVYRDQGDYAQATRCFRHALRMAVELGDWRDAANQVASLAATAAAEGNDRQAERLFATAIELARLLDAPYLLCYSLHHQARVCLTHGRLDEAARLNDEALRLATEHRERDIQVDAELLSIRLESLRGPHGAEAALRRLRALEREWRDPQERAAVLDLLAELGWARGVTDEAAALYRSLYERAPSVQYRERYARLTGVMLPPGPPLPPLPASVGEDVADVDSLVRQVDLAVRQLSAA
jgi:predicted ATPase/class 3 adenylate cyclase